MKLLDSQRYPNAAPIVLIGLLAICAVAQSGEVATRSRTVTTPPERQALQSKRRVFVRSTSLLVRGAVVEDKLLKNSKFKELGFVITRDARDADLVLELRHDLLTMYVFTVVDVKTMNVIAGGKLSSLGGTVAGKVAKRFVKEMSATG
jgi:hypothetical protein